MDNLRKRTLSSFDVSIGTGLMLESLFEPTFDRYDDKREIPNNIKINNYDIHVINLHMLIRNIISASSNSKDYYTYFKDDTLFNIALQEIETIFYLYTNSDCVPLLHAPNYNNIRKALNKDKNVPYNDFEFSIDSYISIMMKDHQSQIVMPYLANDYRLSNFREKKTLISTSHPVDLLNINNTKSLDLLESHTGKLKKQESWYSKYHKIGANDISHLPFNELLLYMLGDTKMIHPIGIKLRKELLKLSIDKKWTPKTNLIKIKNDIVHVPELHVLAKNYKYQY